MLVLAEENEIISKKIYLNDMFTQAIVSFSVQEKDGVNITKMVKHLINKFPIHQAYKIIMDDVIKFILDNKNCFIL